MIYFPGRRRLAEHLPRERTGTMNMTRWWERVSELSSDELELVEAAIGDGVH